MSNFKILINKEVRYECSDIHEVLDFFKNFTIGHDCLDVRIYINIEKEIHAKMDWQRVEEFINLVPFLYAYSHDKSGIHLFGDFQYQFYHDDTDSYILNYVLNNFLQGIDLLDVIINGDAKSSVHIAEKIMVGFDPRKNFSAVRYICGNCGKSVWGDKCSTCGAKFSYGQKWDPPEDIRQALLLLEEKRKGGDRDDGKCPN